MKVSVLTLVIFLAYNSNTSYQQEAAGVIPVANEDRVDVWSEEIYRETYRPQLRYTPAENWMNDPNGMVYYDGEYHLFYQYNPFGNTWGHMSWGHAISKDMIHWEEQDVAMYEEDGVMRFSGSAVVDHNNSSGFGQDGEPPLVAIYTAHISDLGLQTQFIAWSKDRGRTWNQYENNPVIDIGSPDFRDPKVIWHEKTQKWVMLVALSQERKISFYTSDNLRDWNHASDFGPYGALGGVWECPDLFLLTVDGDPDREKWVLQVDIGAGAIAGGSGAMYFIGEFDGTRFKATSRLPEYAHPGGVVFEDFEGPDYGDWVVEGDAFGDGPVSGKFEGQQPVMGFIDDGLVNTFIDGDGPQGSLTSPEFEVESDYISFLIGGGYHPNEVGIKLLVDGEIVRSATGQNTEILDWENWIVDEFRGQTAKIRIFDYHSGGWGHINVDHIVFRDKPVPSIIEQTLWVDYGADFYAAQSWSDVPESDGRRKWLAWMSNWQYANVVPTEVWRSSQSIPRTVTLQDTPSGIRLYQKPVAEFQKLRNDVAVFTGQYILDGQNLIVPDSLAGNLVEIIAEFRLQDTHEFGLQVRKGEDEATVIGYIPDQQVMFVDRRNSGEVNFNEHFPAVHKAELPEQEGRIRLQVIVDWSSVEVFGNDGYSVITDLIFPNPASRGIEVYSKGGQVYLTRMEVWQLESIW